MSEPTRKRQKKYHYDPEEESRLERLVFGDGQDVIDKLLGDDERPTESSRFIMEVTGDSDTENEDSDDENVKKSDDNADDSEKEDAIKSEDDAGDSDEEDVKKSDNDADDSDDVNAEKSDNDDSKSGNREEEANLENDDVDSSDEEFIYEDEEKKNDGAAWVDEDDEKYELSTHTPAEKYKNILKNRPETYYKEYLQNKYQKVYGTPKWAQVKPKEDEEDSDSDNEILKHSNHLAPMKTKKLAKGTLEIKALRDINKETQNEGPWVTNLQFHPTSTVAFVAGLAGIVSLFQIDGKENTKLQSIKFERFSINCAKYLKDGTEIILGSRHKNCFQLYDLMSGKTYQTQLPHTVTNAKKFEVSPDGKTIAVAGRSGEIHLISGHTKELITTIQMNKKCTTMAFTPDSRSLITHGESEEIYVWDINSRRCVHRAVDDGCLAAGAIAVSPSAQFIATGSRQGVVNIYDTKTVLAEKYPQPLKILLNLVTPITSVKFNPTSEILAMASQFKPNAFKMVHLPSFNVFSNFPTYQTVMHSPLDIDFSPNGGYLGISNDKHNAYLYRLKHYGNY